MDNEISPKENCMYIIYEIKEFTDNDGDIYFYKGKVINIFWDIVYFEEFLLRHKYSIYEYGIDDINYKLTNDKGDTILYIDEIKDFQIHY